MAWVLGDMSANEDTGQAEPTEEISVRNGNFLRRSRLDHSPVKNALTMLMQSGLNRQRSLSLTEETFNVDSPKRKIALSPGGSAPKKDKKGDTFEVLLEELRDLVRMIDGQPTVKKETKEKAKMLVKNFAAYSARLMAEKYAGDDSVVASKFRRQLLNTEKSEKALNDIAGEDWPKGVYSATRIGRGGFKDEEAAFSTLVYPEHVGTDKNLLALASKIPEVRHITAELLIERGLLDIVKEEVTAIPGLKCTATKKRHLIQAACISDPGDLRAMDVLKWATTLTEKSIAGPKRFILSIPEDCDLQRVRRILECCLAGTSVEVIIRPNKKGIRQEQRPKLTRKSQTITVNGNQGATYADILKDLKSNVNPEECGVTVRRIATTVTGAVQLTVTESKSGGNEDLMNRIREKVTTARDVKENRRLENIVLMDLDLDVDKTEVTEALIRESGVSKEELKLNDFRPNRYGTKMLTVAMPPEFAVKILRQRRFKVGWTNCVAKEKIDPPFCGKCQWFGHLRKDCTSEAVDMRCLKCGETGHFARECKNGPRCFMCKGDQQQGHSANSMACPEYKKLVDAMKKARNNGL